MRRRPPRSTRTDHLFPYTTLFRSLRGLEEAGDGAQDRRLAAARGAEEAEELAVFDLEICVLNRRELAEANRDVIELYVGAHIRSVPICNAAAARWRGDRKSTRLNSSH